MSTTTFSDGTPIPTEPREAQRPARKPRDQVDAEVAAAQEAELARKVALLRTKMGVKSLKDVRSDVVGRGPREWLVRGVWVKGSAAVIGAEEKAGKSTALADLVAALASGTLWMNSFQVGRKFSVLVFFAEDDDAEMIRRLDAICTERGIDPDDLNVRLCFSPPNLSSVVSLAAIRAELEEFPADVVIVDPLYLAIGSKGDGADLYAMGEVLAELSTLCREFGASPMVAHHWNKTGTGTGRARFSGTGTTQWARSIFAMSVSQVDIEQVEVDLDDGRKVTQVRKTATLAFEITGNSIPNQKLAIRRKMWADDPDDLDSVLHYEVERVPLVVPSDGDPKPGDGLKARSRAFRSVSALGGWVSAFDVQQWDGDHQPLKKDGSPAGFMKVDTFKKALRDLVEESAVVSRVVDAYGALEFAVPGTPDAALVESVRYDEDPFA